MSSGNKSLVSSGGRGTNKNKSSHHHAKSDHHHSKSTDTAKHDKGQSNKDQSKHAQIIAARSGGIEDPALEQQIQQMVEVTRRSVDEVIMALHDSDGDFNRAVNDLLEGVSTEWEVKKKKPRQPSGTKASVEQTGDHDDTLGGDGGGGGGGGRGGGGSNANNDDWQERRNQRGGGAPRLRGRANHANDNRGWRGRENKENERNMEDRDGGGGRENNYGRRGGRGGPARSGRGGRGGGRGLGPRTYANRDPASSSSSASAVTHGFNRPIDTWTGSEEQQQSDKKNNDTWNNLEPAEDWDNEEYTGSLADTKVFTPSTLMSGNEQVKTEEVKKDLQPVISSSTTTTTVQQQQQQSQPQQQNDDLQQQQQQLLRSLQQPQQQLQQQQQQPTGQVLGMPTQLQINQQASTVGGNALTAAQSQYLTQLTQQSSENYKNSSAFSSLPQRQIKQQRPRLPPPSKIPSTAVEMPGDTINSNISFLDVQFGALELGNDTNNIDNSMTSSSSSVAAAAAAAAAVKTTVDKYNTSTNSASSIDASSLPSSVIASSGSNVTNNTNVGIVNPTNTSSNSLDIDNVTTVPTSNNYNSSSQLVASQNQQQQQQQQQNVYGNTTTNQTSAYQLQKNSYQSTNVQSSYGGFATAGINSASVATSVAAQTQNYVSLPSAATTGTTSGNNYTAATTAVTQTQNYVPLPSAISSTAGVNAVNNYTATTTVTQTPMYIPNPSYPQTNNSSFSQASPAGNLTSSSSSSSTVGVVNSSVYNQTTSSNQSYQGTSSGVGGNTSGSTGNNNAVSGGGTSVQGGQAGQYHQALQAATNAVSNNTYQGTTGYQSNNNTFQSSQQAYQPSATTTFNNSSITQTSNNSAYQSATHSVYGNTYGNYNSQQQSSSSLNHTKLNSGTNKDNSQYDSNVSSSGNNGNGSLSSASSVAAVALGLSSSSSAVSSSGSGGGGGGSSVNPLQAKVTSTNSVSSKSGTSGGSNSATGSNTSGVTNSNTTTGTSTGSSTSGGGGSGVGAGGSVGTNTGTTGSMTPAMLSHQYIIGQGMPYATFQQPMYSYEDLQLIQQRMPHAMTTGPATSLGGGRSDALSGVQGVQSVQGVQGAYTNMSDGRFTRNDSNASPVPSTMSQQTATQHQQPIMNATLPPGYAYAYYGGNIMPGGFQYGGPIYPQLPTTGNAGTNSGAYGTKPSSYGSGYGAGASYDTLTNAGPTGQEYKNTGSAYTGTQSGKTGTCTGNSNSGASSAADIGGNMYAKSHVALSKVNSYDKQTFHSATPPPFNLTSSQSGGIPAGYGAPHLFISTMPQHLHQPLHQESGNSSGQRSNTSSQNKGQAKPGYSSTYWAPNN